MSGRRFYVMPGSESIPWEWRSRWWATRKDHPAEGSKEGGDG